MGTISQLSARVSVYSLSGNVVQADCRNANLWQNNRMVGVKDEEVRFFIVSGCHDDCVS